jgi:purine-nucleoside/S-methyl-5'-thioadenosine phosphorylase / adenosine deaminase
VIRWSAAEPYTVVFTTRRGGVSEGPYASLNLGLLTADDPACVAENRRIACARMGIDPERLAMNRQVHGAVVNRAQAGERGRDGDGLWTDEPGIPLLVLGADCLPIVLTRLNGDAPALAVLHVGRLGLLEGIIEAGVAALGDSLAAVVGPAIGACCYEVGEDVAGPYRARFGPEVLPDGRLDLRTAAEKVLRKAGVARIDHVSECTACEEEQFFSHRRDGPNTGRQGLLACVS